MICNICGAEIKGTYKSGSNFNIHNNETCTTKYMEENKLETIHYTLGRDSK